MEASPSQEDSEINDEEDDDISVKSNESSTSQAQAPDDDKDTTATTPIMSTLRQTDVVCGRCRYDDNRCLVSVGSIQDATTTGFPIKNLEFNNLCRTVANHFFSLSGQPGEQDIIVSNIMEHIQSLQPPGRFVEIFQSTDALNQQPCVELPLEKARAKIYEALHGIQGRKVSKQSPPRQQQRTNDQQGPSVGGKAPTTSSSSSVGRSQLTSSVPAISKEEITMKESTEPIQKSEGNAAEKTTALAPNGGRSSPTHLVMLSRRPGPSVNPNASRLSNISKAGEEENVPGAIICEDMAVSGTLPAEDVVDSSQQIMATKAQEPVADVESRALKKQRVALAATDALEDTLPEEPTFYEWNLFIQREERRWALERFRKLRETQESDSR
jgi:hypothetical protein